MKKLYYHLSDNIYITQFRDEVIVLDLKKDNYVVCFEDVASTFIKIFGVNLHDPELNQQDKKNIQKFLNQKLITIQKDPYPFYVDQKIDTQGVSVVDWDLSIDDNIYCSYFDILKAYIMLLKVKSYMKFGGFDYVVRTIKNYKNINEQYFYPSEEELENLAYSINRACLMFPVNTKSLEWSMTFVLIALQNNWICNLEIGVQNHPFFARAWVECGGKVVLYSNDLREKLSIILSEPFRRKKF